MSDVKTGYPSVDKPWLKFYKKEYSHKDIPEGTIFDFVFEKNKNRLNETMIRYFGKNITGNIFFKTVSELASSFQQKGLKKGDKVTLLSLITPETVFCIYALNYIGVVVNSVYLGMSEKEIVETVKQTESKMLIVLDIAVKKITAIEKELSSQEVLIISIGDSLPFPKKALYSLKKQNYSLSNKYIKYEDFLRTGRDSKPKKADTNGNSEAFIVYTSGSTGNPKGVVLTNKNINSTAFNYMNSGISYRKNDVLLSFIPLFLSIGLSFAMHTTLSMSLILDIYPDPTPEKVTKQFLKSKPNFFCGDPHNAVLIAEKCKGDMSYLNTLVAGGASPTVEQERMVNAVLAEHGSRSKLITGYGMTELSSGAITNLNHIYKEGSLGVPLPLNNIRITDIETGRELGYNEQGELWISSPTQMKEYYKNKEDTEKILYIDENNTSWLKTGDLAVVDEDGFVFFKGRIKRIYLKQGEDGTPYKIFPQRVEELIRSLEYVSECAVIVLDDKKVQHIQVAFVELNLKADKEECIYRIQKECTENLPNFMIPEQLIVIKEIPRLSNGKIDYRGLEKEINNN